MKTSLLLVTILSAATLAACSAKIDSGESVFDTTPVQKTDTAETQPMKIDSGVGAVETNTIKVYGSNGNDRTFYFTHTATETTTLWVSSAKISGVFCKTSAIVDVVEFQSLAADGAITKSEVIKLNQALPVVKGQSYKLKIHLTGLSSCDTMYYDIVVQK